MSESNEKVAETMSKIVKALDEAEARGYARAIEEAAKIADRQINRLWHGEDLSTQAETIRNLILALKPPKDEGKKGTE